MPKGWTIYYNSLSYAGRMLHSTCSRIAVAIWLFVAFVTSQSYSASLTSSSHRDTKLKFLTDTLKTSNAIVGRTRGVYGKHLEEVLGFQSIDLKSFSSQEEYAKAVKNGNYSRVYKILSFFLPSTA